MHRSGQHRVGRQLHSSLAPPTPEANPPRSAPPNGQESTPAPPTDPAGRCRGLRTHRPAAGTLGSVRASRSRQRSCPRPGPRAPQVGRRRRRRARAHALPSSKLRPGGEGAAGRPSGGGRAGRRAGGRGGTSYSSSEAMVGGGAGGAGAGRARRRAAGGRHFVSVGSLRGLRFLLRSAPAPGAARTGRSLLPVRAAGRVVRRSSCATRPPRRAHSPAGRLGLGLIAPPRGRAGLGRARRRCTAARWLRGSPSPV